MAMYYIEDIRRLDIRYYLNKPFDNDRLLDKMNDIYGGVYPKRMILVQDMEIKFHRENFFDRFCNILKRRTRI